MNLLYRVLNDFDIACNPLTNGLASKKLIYDLTMSYLEANQKEILRDLNDKEKDKYCRENMMNYINTHQHKLKKMIEKRGNEITRNLSKVCESDPESWAYLLYYLSTINSHLSAGSRIDSDWISTTNNFNSISKYYKNQKIHKVAVLASCSNSIMDDNTIVIDLSSKKNIKDINLMLNKKVSLASVKQILEKVGHTPMSFLNIFDADIFIKTNERFMGFNFATSDNETCIYRFFPSKNVIAVLEQIQIDLITIKRFNYDFMALDKEKQVIELNRLKECLKQIIIELNDPYMLYVFKEIYLENKNIDIIKKDEFDKKRINHNRTKILKLAKNIPNIQTKR